MQSGYCENDDTYLHFPVRDQPMLVKLEIKRIFKFVTAGSTVPPCIYLAGLVRMGLLS